MSIGARLRALLEEREMTQVDLAKHLSLAKSSVSQYISGTRTPDVQTLQAIASFFGVSTDYLLGRSDDRGLSVSETRSPYGDTDDDGVPKGYRILARELPDMTPEERKKWALAIVKLAFPEEFQEDRKGPKRPTK